MASDAKKLDGLSEKIDQYESHLKMVQVEINNASNLREKTRAEVVELRRAGEQIKADADAYAEKKRSELAEEARASEAKKDSVAQDRIRLNKEISALGEGQNALEFERRKLATDRARVDEFLKKIDELHKAW